MEHTLKRAFRARDVTHEAGAAHLCISRPYMTLMLSGARSMSAEHEEILRKWLATKPVKWVPA